MATMKNPKANAFIRPSFNGIGARLRLVPIMAQSGLLYSVVHADGFALLRKSPITSE